MTIVKAFASEPVGNRLPPSYVHTQLRKCEKVKAFYFRESATLPPQALGRIDVSLSLTNCCTKP